MDGAKRGDKVGYAIAKEEHTIRKRFLPQNTLFSAEQTAIIGAIQSKKHNRHKIVTITDSLSTIMAVESRTPTKNPNNELLERCWIMKGQELPSYGSPATKKYQITKRPTRQQRKCWTRTSQPMKDTRQTT
jgi:hypothetical protein